VQDAQKAISKAEASKQLNADVNIIFRSPVIVQRVLSGDLFSSLLARIIHDSSLRNRAVALRDGHAEP